MKQVNADLVALRFKLGILTTSNAQQVNLVCLGHQSCNSSVCKDQHEDWPIVHLPHFENQGAIATQTSSASSWQETSWHEAWSPVQKSDADSQTRSSKKASSAP